MKCRSVTVTIFQFIYLSSFSVHEKELFLQINRNMYLGLKEIILNHDLKMSRLSKIHI